MREIGRKLTALLASRQFFYVVLGFFLFEALWIACSAAYPQAFDEEFHFGIIKFFAGGASPFLAEQPTTADSFGAILRDPSYLYHYLMVVPYRIIGFFTDSQTAIIMGLRLINIALFAWALVLFRGLLLRAKTSLAFTHTALAIFVLIPIVPQLAAHVNYDNLLMVLVAATCLLVARVLDALRARQLDMFCLGLLLLVCMFASLVKFKALPIVAAVVLFTVFEVCRHYRRTNPSLRRAIATGWRQVARPTKYAFVGIFVLLLGLMIQRYGVNIWTYQALNPDCARVLGEGRCEAYGPWARNHRMAAEKEQRSDFNPNPIHYTRIWLTDMHKRLFFAVSGPGNDYRNYPPLPVPGATATVIFVAAMVALVWYWRRVFAGHTLLGLFTTISLLYLAVLFADVYSQFLETGQAVAINGRYLLPIALLMAAVLGRALSVALHSRSILKPYVAAAAILLFLHGGGVMTFILRSDANWYWSNSFVREVNETSQQLLLPVIVEGDRFY